MNIISFYNIYYFFNNNCINIFKKNTFKFKNNLIKISNYISYNNYYFIKKEKIYTKLKYSRVPQFDTSSGAIASLLAALLGFLITERFGFELIDSGDFYTIIMYLIFVIIIFNNLNDFFYKRLFFNYNVLSYNLFFDFLFIN